MGHPRGDLDARAAARVRAPRRSFAIHWGIEKIAGRSPPWTTVLGYVPAALLVGWFFVFWAARGFKSITFLAKYKRVPAPAAPPPCPPRRSIPYPTRALSRASHSGSNVRK